MATTPGFSKTTLSREQRKKLIDQRLSILVDVEKSFPNDGFEKKFERLKSLKEETDTSFQSGNRIEFSKFLQMAEEESANQLQETSNFLKEKSGNLVEAIAKQNLDSESLKSKNIPIKERERFYNNFEMSKKEIREGKKLETSRNYQLSLILFKRSLQYSFACLEILQEKVPESLEVAQSRWKIVKKATQEIKEEESNP